MTWCAPDPARHGALRMTEAARPILRGEADITLRRDTIAKTPRTPQVKMLVSEEDAPLLSALKARRRALAEAARVPAYVIFTDKTLIEMAETRPATLDAMARISGVGATKLEKYGAAFLAVITGETPDDLHPARRKLAGRDAGALYDRLLAVQADLARGETGTDKPMTCSSSQIAKVAEVKPGEPGRSLARASGRNAQRRTKKRLGPQKNFLAFFFSPSERVVATRRASRRPLHAPWASVHAHAPRARAMRRSGCPLSPPALLRRQPRPKRSRRC